MATILRSSKYVRNFTGYATKLSFSHIKGDFSVGFLSPRQCTVPSTFAKSVATQIAAQRLRNDTSLETNLRRLDDDVKRYGRISKAKLERILTAFQNSKAVSSTQALLVIRCCGNLVPDELPESRSELVNQVWKSLENSGIELDLSHYNALLRVYIENEYPFSPAEILAELERKGIEPNKLTYQRLISRYCQQGDIEGASKILEHMREKEISINENVFTALVRGHSEANDMVSAADILSVMKQAGLEPSVDTYKELICGYAKHGDMESITRTLADCQSKNIHLLDTDLLDVISSLAHNGYGQHVEAILSIMPKAVGYLQDALRHVLKLVNSNQVDVAMQVLLSIPNREKGHTGTTVIKQLAKSNLPWQKLLEFCKKIESKGIHSEATLIALENCLLKGNVEGSLGFLQNLQESGTEVREHYFWPLLIELGKTQNNSGIDDLLRTMKCDHGLIISGETLRDYVIPHKTGEPIDILAELALTGLPSGSIACAIVFNLITKMKIREAAEFGTKYAFRYKQTVFCRPLTIALAQTKDVQSYVAILAHIHQNRFNNSINNNNQIMIDKKIIEPYVIDVAVFTKNEQPFLLTKVLEELLAAGLSISDSGVAALQSILDRQTTPQLNKLFNKCRSSSFGFRTPTPMDVENYNLQISKLETSLQNSTNDQEAALIIKKRLLSLYSRIKDVGKLEKLATDLKEEGVEFTDIMYKNLLDVYCDSGILDKTEECITSLKQINPEYTLDETRLVRYIMLLVKNNRTTDAVNYLENEQGLQAKKSGRTKNVWRRLLNTIADLGEIQAVNEIFDKLAQNEYIDISTLSLGPLIKVHIVRDDLKGALNAFERVCETYQHTPLKNELAKKLILAEDANALQRLTDLSTQVHGESNSLYDLAQSFIECDCLRQAKKILEIPALHSKVHRLKICSSRYREQGMTAHLEKLISVIIDLPYFKTLPEFYEDLVNCYDKENNWEGGLRLLRQMEEAELEPSKLFLATLGDLLERNNQHIPFTVPQLQNREMASSLKQSRTLKSERIPQVHGQSSSKTEDNKSISQKDNLFLEESQLIESLIKNGKLNAAFEITENLINRDIYPRQRIFRYFIKSLGIAGEIGMLQQIGEKLSLYMKRTLDYHNSICQAHIVAGKVEEYLDSLEKYLEKPDEQPDDRPVSNVLTTLTGVRRILQQKPEFTARYAEIAEKCAERGHFEAINVLWIHYFIHERPEADKIWSEYLIKSPRILFHSIIRSAEQNSKPELVLRLIKTLETSSVFDNQSKGFAYSKLIKIHYLKGDYQESVNVLREALKTVSVKDLQTENLNKMQSYLTDKNQSLPADLLELIKSQETEVEQVTT